MKIGILTFHNAMNYGAVLQCYALKEILQSRGHETEIIDYRVAPIENSKKAFTFQVFCRINGVKQKIKYLLTGLLCLNQRKRAIAAFDEFIAKNFSVSKKINGSTDIPTDYQMIVFGSDQIWSPRICEGLDKILFGQFPKNGSRFIAYAASLGEVNSVYDEQWSIIRGYMNSFDYLSVREEKLKKKLEELTGRDIACCLDPTLLVSSSTLEKIVIKPSETNYVFLFTVQGDRYAPLFAKQVAELYHCKVITCRALPQYSHPAKDDKYKIIEGMSPECFLGYIKHSRMVIANSFHAVALSLAFEKDFIALDCPRPERLKNILCSLGLENRMMKSSEMIRTVNSIDYLTVKTKLAELQKESFNYLKKVGL